MFLMELEMIILSEVIQIGGSDGKESACNAGDPGSISGLGRSPGEGNSSPLQYSCLENPTDRGAWWAAVHSVAQSQTRLKQLSMHTCIGYIDSSLCYRVEPCIYALYIYFLYMLNYMYVYFHYMSILYI